MLPHASSVNDEQVVHSTINANINSFYIGLAIDLPDCYKTLKPAWLVCGWMEGYIMLTFLCILILVYTLVITKHACIKKLLNSFFY